jgi:hypothetical protein
MSSRSQVSLHRFAAPRALTAHTSSGHSGNFGMGAAVLCSVTTNADGIAVDYGRTADAKAQLQAMLSAVIAPTATTTEEPIHRVGTMPGDIDYVQRAN